MTYDYEFCSQFQQKTDDTMDKRIYFDRNSRSAIDYNNMHLLSQ